MADLDAVLAKQAAIVTGAMDAALESVGIRRPAAANLAALTRIIRDRYKTSAHDDAHLRVGADVLDAMWAASAPPSKPPLPGVIGDLMAIPLVLDAECEPDEWRLVGNRDRKVRESGRIGSPS